MYFNIKIALQENNEEELLRFLNSKARLFYDDRYTFRDKNFKIFFTSSLQLAIFELERCIRGTFNKDLSLKGVDIKLLKKMFPNACENIFNVKDDLTTMGKILEGLRNINAHIVNSSRDEKIFKYDFSHLKHQPRLCNKIHYYTNELTIAGLIFIVLNFMRMENIALLVKRHILFSYLVSENPTINPTNEFITEISKVNLEVNIRDTKANTIEEATLGESFEHLMNDKTFSISYGKSDYPVYKVSGFFKDNIIHVDANSLTKVSYENDFDLEIIDREGYIELANQLPCFILVDYLYKLKIARFDKHTYNEVLLNFDKLKKLNKPKFYLNKNLDILLLPETISDFRLLSSTISECLFRCLLIIESKTLRNMECDDLRNNYSTIKDVLSFLETPKNLLKDLTILRNFAAHGYILNESKIIDNKLFSFTIDFIFKTIIELLNFLKEKDEKFFEATQKDFYNNFLRKIIGAKINSSVSFAQCFAKQYPHYNKETLYQKNLLVDRSYISFELLNDIFEATDADIMVLRVKIEDVDGYLYFKNNSSSLNELSMMCERNSLEIEREEYGGIIYTYYLKKTT